MSKLVRNRPQVNGQSLRKAARLGVALFAFGAVAGGLDGCSTPANPANWFSHHHKHKATDADARNGDNLDAGSNAPYPDLGTVPAPSSQGLTAEQKKALARALVADRDHALHEDTQIADGSAAAPLPDPNSLPEAAPPPDAQGAAPNAAAADAGDALPAPEPSHHHSAASSGAVDEWGFPIAHHAAKHHSALPAESSMQAPSSREEPQPEAAGTPPAQAQLAPVPPPQKVAPLVAVPAGGHVAAAVPVPGAPQLAAVPTQGTPAEPAAAGPLATATFQGDGHGFNMPPGSLQRVTDAFKAQGGKIRVIGFAEPASGADTSGALASYQAALAHAEAVKSMLVAKGIPAAQVTTQAATRSGAGDTAEIQQEP